MPMINLLDYSNNYSMTSVSLRNCHKDEVNDNMTETNAANNYRVNNGKTAISKSFEYNTEIKWSMLE